PASPGKYSPRHHPNAALARRSKVLRNMLATGAITRVEFDHAMAAPLGVTPQRYSNERAPYFTEMVRLHLDERYGSNAVYEGGLRVYTTLDIDLQQAAERALEKQLNALESDLKMKQRYANYQTPAAAERIATGKTPYLQGAFVAVDPRNGYIRAMIGGRDAAVDQHPGHQAAAQGGHVAGRELRAAHGHQEHARPEPVARARLQ